MPRPLLIALIAFVASANLFGQEAKKPSPAVTRILEETARKVRANRQAFDKANEKPLADACQELKDLSTKLIKDGKNMEAQAVLKQIDTLDADVMRMASAPMPGVGGGEAVPSPVGRWEWPDKGLGNQSIELRADGSASASWHAEPCLWTQLDDGSVRAIVTQGRFFTDLQISQDGNFMQAKSGEVLKRLP